MEVEEAALDGGLRRMGVAYGAAFGFLFVVGFSRPFFGGPLDVFGRGDAPVAVSVSMVALIGTTFLSAWSWLQAVQTGFWTSEFRIIWSRLLALGFAVGGFTGMMIGLSVLAVFVIMVFTELTANIWAFAAGWLLTIGAVGGALAGIIAATGFGLMTGLLRWWQEATDVVQYLVAGVVGAVVGMGVGWMAVRVLIWLLERLPAPN